MILETLVSSLVVGNFFILTGFFVTVIMIYRYSVQVNNELRDTKLKLQEQDKKIQTLQTTLASYDIISALTNASLYYGSSYPSQTPNSNKKPTTPKPSLSVLKSENKTDEPQ